MNISQSFPGWRLRLSLFFWFVACLILLLSWFTPESASEEYLYTIDQIVKFALTPCILAAIFLLPRKLAIFKNGCVFFFAACVLLAIPCFAPPAIELDRPMANALAICWAAGLASITVFFFWLGAKCKNIMSMVYCLIATVFLCLATAETVFIITTQNPGDGYQKDAHNSKYVKSNQAQAELELKNIPAGSFPVQPAHPSHSVAHRDLYYGQPLFDVRYTFDEHGHRVMPPANSSPRADLLLFGCSFTFGHGLENEQTWAWQLATLLGPEWRVTNYAFNGFGPQQMLGLLEERALLPLKAPRRFAFFLALKDQLRRPVGLFDLNSVAYTLHDGQLARTGFTRELGVARIHSLARLFNGSQLAREATRIFITGMISKNYGQYATLYVAILAQAARLLREDYDTSLTVLLWPDLEDLLPQMLAAGLDVVPVRPMLDQWEETGGKAYHIVQDVEFHPNVLASTQLAQGISALLKQKLSDNK